MQESTTIKTDVPALGEEGSMPEKAQKYVRLGVNVDHVATLRNVRGQHSDLQPIARACAHAMEAGAHFITAHLREDRRHIQDQDIRFIAQHYPLNFEMAPTEEMCGMALQVQPQSCCLVPEKRQELTTEGGLNLTTDTPQLEKMISRLKGSGIRVSLFIEPSLETLKAAHELGAHAVELHTGLLAQLFKNYVASRLSQQAFESLSGHIHTLAEACQQAHQLGLSVHAGHGLNFETTYLVGTLPFLEEVSIGHFIVSESLFTGWKNVIHTLGRQLEKAQLCRPLGLEQILLQWHHHMKETMHTPRTQEADA